MINDWSRENTNGVIKFSAKAPSGQTYFFEAARKGQAFEITRNGVPINVLAPRVDAKAFTADYDLLVISPHISDIGPQDNLLVPDISHGVFRSKINQYRGIPSNAYLLHDYLNAKSFYKKEDADIGNTSMRVRNMIPIINQALVGDGEAVVHHNTDSGSPATDIKANYPTTFALPMKIGRFDEICVVRNKEEFAELIQQAKSHGYHMPLNPLWEEEVKNVQRAQFVDAKNQLQALKSRGA
ncbi:hypothetical protein [Chitinimonas sp. BJB300]|uniref:hypothetical protein n=1 Tax=Chitinimonas sp. BJB300 TaxID=1559339 RepID=UPI001E5E37F6|nr:hypothetical protein [Chitinimonas sp. BJB300]